MKRRKRVKEAELSSSSVTGQYKKSDESSSDNDRSRLNERCGGKENVVNGSVHGVSTGGSLFNLTELFEKKSRIPNPWNTLRRSKHQSSDVTQRNETLRPNSKIKNDVRLKNLQKLDLYRSSPSILGPDLNFKTVNKRRSEGDKYFPSLLETGADVLQYTNWDTYGSLITLNFGDDDRIYKPEFKQRDQFPQVKETNGFMENSTIIPTSDCESDIYEELTENEDSGTFCDSDSGISSLYETIIKYQSLPGTSSNRNSFVLPETIKETDHELDNDNVSLENHLQKLKVDPKLVHIFQRNYIMVYTSHVFAMEFDVLTKVPVWNNSLIRVQENVSEIKRAMLKTVTRQQQFLRTTLTRMKTEKATVDDFLRSLADCLINDASNKLVKKYNRFVDQIDSLVNLLYGLELKIANLSNSGKPMNDVDQWKTRLQEALAIKVMHDESLNMIVNHLETNNQHLFRDQIKLKQKLICEIRLLNQELYYLEMQLRILFMY